MMAIRISVSEQRDVTGRGENDSQQVQGEF